MSWRRSSRRAREGSRAAARGAGRGGCRGGGGEGWSRARFAWGLRRGELASLDVVDFRPHPKLLEFGAFGQVHVRWGKAKRGGGPQRRTVLTVFEWAVDVVEQ